MGGHGERSPASPAASKWPARVVSQLAIVLLALAAMPFAPADRGPAAGFSAGDAEAAGKASGVRSGGSRSMSAALPGGRARPGSRARGIRRPDEFQTIRLDAPRILSLACGDVMEKDWNDGQRQNARRDVDLVVGADASGTAQLSVWFNWYDNNPLFNRDPDFACTAPNDVLALAVDTISAGAPFQARREVVGGTKLSGAGNLFVWFCQASSGNEGYPLASYSLAYTTQDRGDARAIATGDVAGGAGIDILVGTKSPAAGQGTIELWKSDDDALPAFSRLEVYPPSGGLPGGRLGEVTGLVLTSLRGSGQDLVVGTRTGDTSGQLAVFSRVDSASVFTLRWLETYGDGAVTCLAVGDIDDDGRNDIVVGLRTGSSQGRLEHWRNSTRGDVIDLERRSTSTLGRGFPLCVALGDLVGAKGADAAVGWRADEKSYEGGVSLYDCDGGSLPAEGSDPSDGSIVNMVPAIALGDFNYGVKPSPPPPRLRLDFIAGVRKSVATGELVVFVH